MDARTYVRTYVCMYICIYILKCKCVYIYMNMAGWRDGWMDGRMYVTLCDPLSCLHRFWTLRCRRSLVQ